MQDKMQPAIKFVLLGGGSVIIRFYTKEERDNFFHEVRKMNWLKDKLYYGNRNVLNLRYVTFMEATIAAAPSDEE